MIFINKPQKYSPFGTNLPDCKSIPFDSGEDKINIGGIGISINSNTSVRCVGVKLNGVEYFFPNPVVFIDRTLYGPAGVFPNTSELIGNAMRSLYFNEFSLTDVPFLFTCGYDSVSLQNFTAHGIDNSSITNHNNTNAYMIYQFRDNSGNWSANYGSGSFNFAFTSSIAINSDIDPYMRCSLENISNIELKSLYTTQPDIILSGLKNNPNNVSITLTYISHLSSNFIDQLFYPVLQLGQSTNCSVFNIGAVNMSTNLKLKLQELGWFITF